MPGKQPVDIPNLHDSNLWRIENVEPDRTKICFRTVENDVYEMDLFGVERFRCDNFLEGNIVFGLYFITDEEEIQNIIKRILEVKHVNVGTYASRLVEDVKKGKKQLIAIDPSYGCEISCVCNSFEFHKI